MKSAPRSIELPRSLLRALALGVAGWLTFTTTAPAQNILGGISFDAKGMLHESTSEERLELLRRAESGAKLDPAVDSVSPLRKVSLRRLEQVVKAVQEAKRPLPTEVRHLAGLQRVQYVFFFPEQQDVVIAGPAEGWKQAATGEQLGKRSNHPVLHLDDLIVALRFAFGQTGGDAFQGCLIETSPAGLKNCSAFVLRLGHSVERPQIKALCAGIEQVAGAQEIRLAGVPATSRFAQVMVAADYRLKRIAMKHDPSPVKEVTSYIDLAAHRLQTGKAQIHQSWWFEADFNSLSHTADKLAFELEGQGVKVLTAPSQQRVESSSRVAPEASRPATQFVQAFTLHFEELAAQVPVFGELQNLQGLAVAAWLIHEQGPQSTPGTTGGETPADAKPEGTAGWQPGHLLDGDKCPLEAYPLPTQTASLASNLWTKRKHLTLAVSGGVKISPPALAGRLNLVKPPEAPLNQARAAIKLPRDERRWWWD